MKIYIVIMFVRIFKSNKILFSFFVWVFYFFLGFIWVLLNIEFEWFEFFIFCNDLLKLLLEGDVNIFFFCNYVGFGNDE